MLAERLRDLRKSRRMTATGLAAAAQVSKSFISQLESGRTSVSLATLERIAGALGVSTGVLLAPERPITVSTAQGERLSVLHTSEGTGEVPGIRVLSDEELKSHALLTLTAGSEARGTSVEGSILITILQGRMVMRSGEGARPVAAGDIVRLPQGGYELESRGAAPAVALVSAPGVEALPRIVSRAAVSTGSVPDVGGPFRLVEMRAARSGSGTADR